MNPRKLQNIEAILAPVQLDDGAQEVLTYAAMLAERFDARLHVLHALPSLARTVAKSGLAGQGAIGFPTMASPLGAAAAEELPEVGAAAERRLQAMVAQTGLAAERATCEVSFGSMEDALEERSPRYDMVVVGRRDRSWIERVLYPDHAKTAVDAVACPLVVVPEGFVSEHSGAGPHEAAS